VNFSTGLNEKRKEEVIKLLLSTKGIDSNSILNNLNYKLTNK
jgi:hypothetical protein